MKKFLSILFAVTLTTQVLAEEFTIGQLKYTITNAGKYEVTVSKEDLSTWPTGDIVILIMKPILL